MTHSRYYKSSLLAFALLAVAPSCSKDAIELPAVDETRYQVPDASAAAHSVSPLSYRGEKATFPFEFRDKGAVTLSFRAQKSPRAGAKLSVAYDANALEAYNKTNGTKYQAYPQEGVTIAGEGALVFEEGRKEPLPLSLELTHVEGTLSSETYLLPLVLSGDGDPVFMPVFVKDLSGFAGTDKASGVKIFSCMEVNDTNPLNNLSFTLKNSGKQLIDVVILFSANINYNEATGRAYVYNNENVQALLDHREKYLKPLQDRGIKVLLGILGNHDRAGVANLGKEAAKDFAREVSNLCTAYSLDGVFLDDEYSNYGAATETPGFVYPSSGAASRLCYELKQAMPDRIVSVYVYGNTYSLTGIEGKQPGDFIDYALHDYRRGSDLTNNYAGLPKSGWGLYSQEFNRGYFAWSSQLQEIRAKGCGAHMIFAMDPLRSNSSRQIMALQDIARYLFDDELVDDGMRYEKDWK